MQYLRVKNWEEFQHYKKRNPPWIKLYHGLLDDYEFDQLPDSGKLSLVCLFLLACRTNNKVPYDESWIQKKSTMKGKIDLESLLESKWIHVVEG